MFKFFWIPILILFQSLIGNNEHTWGWDLTRNKVSYILFYFTGAATPLEAYDMVDPTLYIIGL